MISIRNTTASNCLRSTKRAEMAKLEKKILLMYIMVCNVLNKNKSKETQNSLSEVLSNKEEVPTPYFTHSMSQVPLLLKQ